METMTPAKLELALAVQQEIDEREAETGRLYQMQVERARYESTLAERRYKAVDPDNRLVAGHWKQNGMTGYAMCEKPNTNMSGCGWPDKP